jgi:uncharacterized protein
VTDLILVGIAGFAASMVDGALGMGFGPTSSSILLSSGISPAAASATVNIAKVATGISAGISHWKFKNIDRRLVLKLAIPGVIGAIIGTTVLANVDGKSIRPYLAALLILVGLRILLRFSRPLPPPSLAPQERADGKADTGARSAPQFNDRGTEIAGVAGGVTNGLIGAWGPVVTPFLLHRGVPPRFAIGSVNTAEVAVAVTSVGSLLTTSRGAGIEAAVVIAMLAGGVIAAPLAAYVVRFVPARLMGLAVAMLLLLTQARELANLRDFPGSRWIAYIGIPVAGIAAALRPRLQRRFRARSKAKPAQ